jgi:predicted peptidase
MISEIEKLYPVDRTRVFILGHSRGAAQTMSAVSSEPKLYRAAAALGGGGAVTASDDLKKVAILVGVGSADFALNGARTLHERLKKAEVATVEYREYPNVEHVTVVQLGLRDVFAFFDRTLEK